jgi:probable HAF family extracellular repeat protein
MPVYIYTTLDAPLATTGTNTNGINDAGQIVGYSSDRTGDRGFLYSNGTYTPLDEPKANPGEINPFGINAAGDIVGSYSDLNTTTGSGGSHGFLLSKHFRARRDSVCVRDWLAG